MINYTQHDRIQNQPWMLADTVHVDIVTAESAVFSGRAKLVVVTGEQGELGILPGHTPLLTKIKPGHVRLVKKEDSEEEYYISGGFLEVQPDHVTILADTIVRADEIDEERALAAKKAAEEVIIHRKIDHYTAALIELSKALAQLRILRRWQRRQ
jgi:F-type H+-transporting ATPase subunit epsilon